jgi:hypothetical protein
VPSKSAPAQFAIDAVDVEALRVEVAAYPDQVVLVLVVAGVGDGVKEVWM